MNASEPPPASASLAGRLAAAVRAGMASRPAMAAARRDWWIAGGVAALIASGPLATSIGAEMLAANVRAEAAKLGGQAAPRVAAEQAAARDRAALVGLLRRPGLGATLEPLARALPSDAALLRVERNAAGLLEADISAPDPDRLRAALRREPALARLRDTGQQQGEVAMTVSLRELPQ